MKGKMMECEYGRLNRAGVVMLKRLVYTLLVAILGFAGLVWLITDSTAAKLQTEYNTLKRDQSELEKSFNAHLIQSANMMGRIETNQMNIVEKLKSIDDKLDK